MLEVQVRLFGVLRDYTTQDRIAVSLPPGASLEDLREAVAVRLAGGQPVTQVAEILRTCAVADETTILSSDHTINSNSRLAMLPPVCGG